MAESIISSLFKASPLKIVNENDGYVYWDKLAVKRVDVVLDTSVTDNPLANKSYTEESLYSDVLDIDVRNGKLIRPAKLKITCLSSDGPTIEGLIAMSYQDTVTFRITTKAIISSSMMMVSLSIEQTAEMTSACKITLEFEQSEKTASAGFDPADLSCRSNYGISIQVPKSVVLDGVNDMVNNLTDSVSGLYNKVLSAF